MARTAMVTYEQVAAVADGLYAQGVKDPGAKAIREELAKRAGPGGPVGSPNTIQRHLMAWRTKDRPREASEVPQLPPQLAADISRALVAASSVAREKGEERLAQVQTELDELAAAGEAADNRIEELQQDLAARTSERDSMAGQLAQRSAEVVDLKEALAAAIERSAALERNLHAAQAQAQAAEGRVDEIRQATGRQLAQRQTELEQAKASLLEAQQRANEAEKLTIAAEAHLEGERAANAALERQLTQALETVQRLEGDAMRAAAAEAAAGGLREQVALLGETNAILRTLVPGGLPDAVHGPGTGPGNSTKTKR